LGKQKFTTEGGSVKLPDRDLLTRGDLRRCLGVGNSTIAKWVESGVLRRRVLPGMKHGRFLREDVERVMNGHGEAGKGREAGKREAR
jgi:hypothetical protein